MLKTAPSVFAVGKDYQIMFEVEKEALVSVRVGEKTFFDESNGIMNSLSSMHRVTIPSALLNKEKKYTVCVRPLIERKPYFSETSEILEFDIASSPYPKAISALTTFQIPTTALQNLWQLQKPLVILIFLSLTAIF